MKEPKSIPEMSSEFLNAGSVLPLVLRPASDPFDLAVWAERNRDHIEITLLEYGGILFRDAFLDTQDHFERFISTFFPTVLHYVERSTPRTKLSERVYTSTEYPRNRSIALHNESSYSSTWPGKICFYCLTPAHQNGETPLADVRRVYDRIPPHILGEFAEKGWRLVRNYMEGAGLTWQTAFQTEDRSVVEEYCRASEIHCEWRGADHLRTSQSRNAIARHPKTAESVWFNHAAFWHISSLEPEARAAMLEVFQEEDLPYNTYYGDGSRIDDTVVEQIRKAYEDEKVVFSWMKGDLLLLDNMLVAHGRNPFGGPRQILVAMAEPGSNRGGQ